MKPQVMLLGTFHFHQSEGMGIDIISDERQNEIHEIAEKIALFRPNKIAIEKLPKDEKNVNTRYHRFLADGFIDVSKYHRSRTLYKNKGDVNEIVMLAFRIGKLCGVSDLIGINYVNIGFIFKTLALRYAKHNDTALYKSICDKEKEFYSVWKEACHGTLLNSLIALNDPMNIIKQHTSQFLDINQVGAFGNYLGSKFVQSWYARNLHIFANIQTICKENDRVLVLYGAGHLVTLQSLLTDYPEVELVSPLAYLRNEQI